MFAVKELVNLLHHHKNLKKKNPIPATGMVKSRGLQWGYGLLQFSPISSTKGQVHTELKEDQGKTVTNLLFFFFHKIFWEKDHNAGTVSGSYSINTDL